MGKKKVRPRAGPHEAATGGRYAKGHPTKANPGLEPAKWCEATKEKMAALARAGMADKEIAANLPVHPDTFARWLKSPEVRRTLQEARDSQAGQGFWKHYLVGRLSDRARRAWDRIHGAAGDLDALAGVHRLLDRDGLRVRQEVFLAALAHFQFRLGRACDCVGVRRAVVADWCKTDPDFAELLAEVHEAKKDFFEAAFIDLVREGNPAAVIFAARSLLADRGYNPKKVVEQTTTVTHTGTVTVEQLDGLTADQKRDILNALRAGRGAPRLAAAEDVRTAVPEPAAVIPPKKED